MDGAWLARARWRLRGAWLWPAFAALTCIEAIIGHALPPLGESQSLASALLIAAVINVLAVLLLSRPLGALMRRRHPDAPKVVARDYGGRIALLAVALILLTVGLLHRPSILAHRRAMRDAIVRAQAWIGDRAPAEFRRNLRWVSTFAIEPGHMYRTCVPSVDRTRTYCVIVDTRLPFPRSVRFAGYESNSVFSQGTG